MADNVIYNQKKLNRPVVFSGLPHVGSCSPTDIDAPDVPFCIEVGDRKRYLIGDFKERGKHLNAGQKILLERHVNAFRAINYTAFAFLAWHPDYVDEIDAAEALVVYQYGGYPNQEHLKWIEVNPPIRLIDKYRRFFMIKGDPNAMV